MAESKKHQTEDINSLLTLEPFPALPDQPALFLGQLAVRSGNINLMSLCPAQ